MYSTLHVIDTVVEADPPLYFQTDHRTAAEIEEEAELSTLFALTRVLVPLRMNPAAKVVYVPAYPLPSRLEDVLAAASAYVQDDVEASSDPRPAERTTSLGINDFADAAFAELADKVRVREALPDGKAGLELFEERLAAQDLQADDREQEIEYWTAIVELAAVAGEVLRDELDGSWVFDEHDMTSVPFLFSSGDHLLNPTGKAEKFIANGPSDAPSTLLGMVLDYQADEHLYEDGGTIMVSLKPSGWAGSEFTVGEPILDESQVGSDLPPVPFVAYGADFPNTFSFFRKDGDEDPVDVRAQARVNLQDVEADIKTVDFPDGQEYLLIDESYFAAEKILDPAFMTWAAGELGASLLVAAIPQKSLLLIADAECTSEQMVRFCDIVQSQYSDVRPDDALYPLPFLVSSGRVVGVAEGSEKPVKKPGLFKRLFK